MEGILRGEKHVSFTVRSLIFLVLASAFVVMPAIESDARVCPDGTISDHCTAPACDPDDPLGCYPEPPVTLPGACGSNYLAFHPPLTIRGSVMGPGEVGVADACVYWVTQWGHGSVKTDAAGLFVIDVAADVSSTYLYVRKDYMTWDSETITTAEFIDPAKRARVDISYTQGVSISPFAFNGGAPRDITISVVSAAPTNSARVLAEPLPGTVLTLARDSSYTGPAPLTKWIATTTVPAGLTEGVKEVPTCILSFDGSGNCVNPGPDIIFSGIPQVGFRGLFAVDNTPPTLGSSLPSDLHSTTDRQPEIRVIPADTLSGPDWIRGSLYLDRVPIGPAYGSILAGVPSTPLEVGIHSVTATIWDLAGNSSVVGWRFAVTTLKPGPATVTVTPKTVSVAPSAVPGFCCQYITFPSVETRLSSFDLELGGSPLWNGVGTISRNVYHRTLKVTFRSAAQTMTVPIDLKSSIFPIDIAVLEPNTDELVVNVPAATSTIPYIGVYVPHDFVVTTDTTATVWADEEPADTTDAEYPVYWKGDPLPDALPECSGEQCTVAGVLSCHLRSTTSEPYSCNGTYPRVVLERDQRTRLVLGKIRDLNEDVNSRVWANHPTRNPAKADSTGATPHCSSLFLCRNLLDPNAGGYAERLHSHWSTGSAFKAYGYHYFFSAAKRTDSERFENLITWQVSEVRPAISAAGTQCIATKLRDFGNVAEAEGGWRLGGQGLVTGTAGTTGTVVEEYQSIGPLRAPLDSADPSLGSRFEIAADESIYRVKNVTAPPPYDPKLGGWHELAYGEVVRPDLLGAVIGTPLRQEGSGVVNLWHPTIEDDTDPTTDLDYRDNPAEVTSGSIMIPPDGTTSSAHYELTTRVVFRFFLSGC